MTDDLERRLRESAQMTRDDVFQAEPDLLDEAADEIARLRAENEALREALKPLSWHYTLNDCGERVGNIEIPIEDLRRAAAAIRTGEAEQ